MSYAEGRGVDTSGLLREVGLTSDDLVGPEARVTEEANNAVWAAIVERSRDPHFGLHFAENMTLDVLDVVGHLVARSRTFGEGLERVVAYSRILHDAGRVEVERHHDRIIVFPGCRGLLDAAPAQVAEFSAASVLVMGRQATGKRLVANAVRFRHAKPRSIAEHIRVFGVAPTFDQPETEVELDVAAWDLPTIDSQPGLLTYLDAYARDVLAQLPSDDDVVSRVERTIAATLSRGAPDIDAVARQLGVGRRTLQRRLAEAETSFQVLVDAVRRRYAERYLAGGRLAIGEIAFLVGFSEPSNFHRAFRRWTGQTPAAYRAEHCA